MRHPHGIHCLHVLGWETRRWCRPCFNHWQETCGEHRCPSYEKTADQYLAHCVVLSMEDGSIAIPPAILSLDLSDLGLTQSPPEPSAN
jgi:hypothetical protein